MPNCRIRAYIVLTLCVVPMFLAACGESTTAPTTLPSTSQPTPNPAPPAPTLTGLGINGNKALSAVGEKIQLSAVATYSDGTTKDVTSEASWTSDKPGLFTVSAGEVTVVGFGVAGVIARVQTRQVSVQITATPPGTMVFWGRVREPGLGGMPGVRVLEVGSGRSTDTDSSGIFQFPGLTSARFRFEREGYEPVEMTAAPPTGGSGIASFTDAALQRVVRITAGDTVNEDLAPHDLKYTIGADTCYPCKLIRVMVPASGTLRLQATSTGAARGLSLWVNGVHYAPGTSTVTADAPVNAGEVIVYAGAQVSSYVKFTLTTSWIAP